MVAAFEGGMFCFHFGCLASHFHLKMDDSFLYIVKHKDLCGFWKQVLKLEDPRVWSLTCLENVSKLYIYDNVHGLIGLYDFSMIVKKYKPVHVATLSLLPNGQRYGWYVNTNKADTKGKWFSAATLTLRITVSTKLDAKWPLPSTQSLK